MAKSVVFLGMPGAGKGTQAKLYAESTGIAHISTGEMLRAAVQGGSTLGRRVQEIMDAGQLVPDELMVQIIEARTAEDDCQSGYILDGFPRTVNQAEALELMLHGRDAALTAVVLFNLPEGEVISRLANRREEEGRADDNEEVQKARLSVYREQTEPLIEFYREKGMLRTVNAEGDVESIQSRLVEALK